MPVTKRLRTFTAMLLALAVAAPLAVHADEDPGIAWQTETLANGLKVVYAPLPSSPVTQVRVLYHVGSKDEQPQRQGFAHMFEHMMFRGSEHVKPQVHMRLIGLVGGISNAFTSFDETVYHDTLPSTSTEMALWLEADRMASFKVSQDIFRTERLVVAEEWRWRQNKPYGTLFEEILPEVFTTHHYRWAPIGNMNQLLASSTGELQAFFNKYYIPNNAVLVIAGNIDLPTVKKEVADYYGWIPAGAPIERTSPKEPPQTEARRKEVTMRVPLSRVVISYRLPPIISDDQDPIGIMLTILGEGQSSRLSRILVSNDSPSCISANAGAEPLEDGGLAFVDATLLQGKDPAAVEKILREQVADMIATPVTPDELEKAKQIARLGLATRWETAESTASELGDEMLYRGNLDHEKTARTRLEAITAADVQRVAATYFAENLSNVLTIHPGKAAPLVEPTTQAAASVPASDIVAKAPPRNVVFPEAYPTTPPASGKIPTATFDKGVESALGSSASPATLIVMQDHRVPIVNWSITLRTGGYAAPVGKEGLGSMTAEMLQRGPKGKSYEQFSEELESRGISLSIEDGGDVTRIQGSCLKEQFPFAIAATRDMLTSPAFDPTEFAHLKAQSIDGLKLALNNPQTVASRLLTHTLYGDTPEGRMSTPATLAGISLDDVKAFYASAYHAPGAIVLLSGDISPEDGKKAVDTYLGPWANVDATLPTITYPPIAAADKPRIILVDAPMAKQSSIRMGFLAYDLHSAEKPAGLLAGQILSDGIDSRLNKYVRAEKGYVYGVTAFFEPNRHTGMFEPDTETKFETTAATVQAIEKVLDDMKTTPLTEAEVAEARFRVAGQLVMSMEKIHDQAARRLEALLDGYPIDYYDKYPERLAAVTPEAIQALMNKYVDENRMTIVVAAPVDAVKAQLEKLGPVEVVPMPLKEQTHG
jgi:zinc protease